jgi:hypothetical protein
MVPVSARSMQPASTNGATVPVAEEASSKHNYTTLSFSNSTQQFACFELPWPKSSNEGTISFQYECRHASGTGNVEFALEAVGVGNGDTEDVAYGTAVSVITALSTTGRKYTSTESGALTVGSLAEGDTVKFRIKRVTSTSGNITQPVQLEHLRVYLTTNAGTDA